ncbi:MAG: hypothetical protein ABF247_11800 [Nonlabens sp.]|uniref:hypothetical protein n=1 Tax=Nonlabens sp. TaxID=1888209 RepID=UPI00321B7049
MASIISANIDLTKIDKSKIYEGKKGKYYPITIVLNDEVGQFGDSGYVQTEQTKEERDAKAPKSFLGNVKVVWSNGSNVAPAPRDGEPQHQQQNATQSAPEPDLPF